MVSRADYQYADLNGTSLAYAEAGIGEPVLFVHGGVSDLRCWTHQIPVISRQFRAITYSCRYAFPNEVITEDIDGQWPQHVTDLGLLLDALDASPAHLVGNSSGALICLLFALKHPEKVRSLVLEEPPVVSMYVSTPPRLPELASILFKSPRTAAAISYFGARIMERVRKSVVAGDDENGIRNFVEGVLGDQNFDELSIERQQQIRDNFSWLKVMLLNKEGFPRLLPSEVQRLEMPVLLINGQFSPWFFITLSDRLGELIHQAKRVLISGASHLMHEDKPKEVNEAILEFLITQRLECV